MKDFLNVDFKKIFISKTRGSDELHCDDLPKFNKYCETFRIYSIFCDFSNKKYISQNSIIFFKKYSEIKIINGNKYFVNGKNSLSLKILTLIKSYSIFEKFNNFSNFFPNLIYLSIIKSNMNKTESDYLKKLQYLDLSFNPINDISIINNFSCLN